MYRCFLRWSRDFIEPAINGTWLITARNQQSLAIREPVTQVERKLKVLESTDYIERASNDVGRWFGPKLNNFLFEYLNNL